MYAKDYRRIAREKLSGNWGVSIGASLVACLLGGAVTGNNVSFNLRLDENTIQLMPPQMIGMLLKISAVFGLLALVHFIIGGVIRQGHCRFLLNQQDGREHHVKDLFSQFDRFGDGFVLQLLQGLFTMLWTFLFIIPGIIAAYRYAMAPFILLENPGMKASQALKASSEMMEGHKWQLFCMEISFFGWALLAVLTCGIGMLWLEPYMSAANAAFYREISK